MKYIEKRRIDDFVSTLLDKIHSEASNTSEVIRLTNNGKIDLIDKLDLWDEERK